MEVLNPIEIRTSLGDSLQVNPLGAKINLSLKNTAILTTVIRGDGKTCATHPCSPIFGPDINAIYGLSQHGNMRNEICDVHAVNANEFKVSYTITDKGYPSGILVNQILSIHDSVFTLTYTHTNTGNEGAAVNACEHCYFHAPQRFNGSTINLFDIEKTIADSSTGTVINLEHENIISIPGKPKYKLISNGFTKVALWVGKYGLDGSSDTDYICVEPVELDPNEFGKEKSIIKPGESRTSFFSLQLL